ncbi:hypothetical protein JQ557_18110 [Bradyrhizobium sp. U87765 SZCCT0131]|uniref:hypothetical protein n=1 Tax=unclassified Bradyrhizobium TaxID=2631580 RepID=UPI001BA8CFE7|nr:MULTISPECIES: hypothetical protein [unclassified Bradyrhizobium]MBR1219928.1 hypothetical protein [Bradyrhizobium sp. U87765 SZCCT0131]MBR1263616.1 hypothetical protein [Bradyrhizobium sp. U87765 SZCCT0134]MBR1309185.1 hypothetical protein [Bradyrhizobium sp. U87765 SZCCT0110]MBR1323948.1 hypothetical protein [Bradyrhizobium sp. U87765 SZCCT0109]MBR1349500.1 hypothetical protein [Bradyrhizobium sp. U87765 SZCCT0048]
MQLNELIEQVAEFNTAAPKERIKLLAWWLHTHGGKEFFGPTDIRQCCNKLHIGEPPSLATYLSRLADAKDLIAERGKYKLARSARSELDKMYGVHHSVVTVSKILTELPAKVPSVEERAFLQEALKCYRIEAYRACIVMTWNLAYAHLLDWILKDVNKLTSFNTTIPKRFPALKNLRVSKYDDFRDELKERQVVEICSSAGLINDDIFKILKAKLDRRNSAAHPSTVVVVQSQADDMITDLINNVVLALT